MGQDMPGITFFSELLKHIFLKQFPQNYFTCTQNQTMLSHTASQNYKHYWSFIRLHQKMENTEFKQLQIKKYIVTK